MSSIDAEYTSSNPSTQQGHSQRPASRYLTVWFSVLVLFIIGIAVAHGSTMQPPIRLAAFGSAIMQAFLVIAYLSMLLALILLYWCNLSGSARQRGQV